MVELLKTLAEPTRLRIAFLLLHRQTLCVCELIELLQLEQSVVSRHLAYMRRNNLVSAERRGTWMYYQLDWSGVCAPELLQQWLVQAGQSQPELRNDLNKLDQLAAECCD